MEREAQLREKAKAQAIAAKVEPSPTPKPADTPATEAGPGADAMDLDVKMETADAKLSDPTAPAVEDSKEEVKVNGHAPSNGMASDDMGEKPALAIWHPELEPLFDDIRALLPEEVAQRIGCVTPNVD
jgi:hypothetical protein